MAMAQGFSREQVQSILEDVRSSNLIDEATRSLLIFSEKMNDEPYKLTSEDIDQLRKAQLSDEAILEGLHVIAFFNYMDRMADALGTPVENFQHMMEKKSK
jgi:alkylhydroperoxidase family enzyme